jgi:hypothetical protein
MNWDRATPYALIISGAAAVILAGSMAYLIFRGFAHDKRALHP